MSTESDADDADTTEADCRAHSIDLEGIGQRFGSLIAYLVVVQIQRGEGL